MKKLIVFAAMSALPFAYSSYAEDVIKEPVYSGSFTKTVEGDIIGSSSLANIPSDKDINVSVDIKTDEKDATKIVSGSIKSESIDLSIDVKSEKGNATAFKAGAVNLATEFNAYESKDDGTAVNTYSNPEAITLSDGGSFKGVFKAEAAGEAIGIEVDGIDADENEVTYLDKDGNYVEKESKSGNIDLTVVAKGKNATGIEINANDYPTALDAGNVTLNVTAEALGGDAEAVDVNHRYGGLTAGEIFADGDLNITASAVAKALYTEADDKSVTATYGDAEGLDGIGEISAKSVTLNVFALSEGDEATAVNVEEIEANKGNLNASAETVVIEETKSADQKTVTYVVDDAKGIVTKYGVEFGNEIDEYDEGSSVEKAYNKVLPSNILKNVSSSINVSAKAGSLFNADGEKLAGADATAFEGDIEIGNRVYLDNTADISGINDDAKKYAAAQEMSPIDINSIATPNVELNGSFKAEALGGTAIAIDADEIMIGSEVTLSQYKYQYEQAKDADGNLVFEDEAKTTPVYTDKLVVDKDGKPVLTKDSSGNFETVTENRFIAGDFNADVSAVGEKAQAIKANTIDANINGKITAVSTNGYARGIYGDINGDVNGEVSVSATNGNAMAIKGNTAGMTLYGKVSAEATDGKAFGIRSVDGIINLGDGAEVTATKYTTLIDAPTGKVLGVKAETAEALGNEVSGTGLTVNVDGSATVNGHIVARSPLNIDGEGTLVVNGGILQGDVVNVAENSSLSLGINERGEMATVKAAGGIQYASVQKLVDEMTSTTKAEEKAAAASKVNEASASKRAEIIAGTATTLVNEEQEVSADTIKGNAFTSYDNEGNAVALKGSDLENLSGNKVNFSYLTDVDKDGVVTAIKGIKVNSLSYFQEKAKNANESSLGKALDSIETLAEVEAIDMDKATQAEKDAYADAVAERATKVQAMRDFKANVDKVSNMSDFMPQAQAQVAQMNAEMLMNANLVKSYRLSAKADEKRAGRTELQAENSPAQKKNAAELISINMLGSQDGSSTAEGFDFWSAGALAAIERDFSRNFFAGLSLGGLYNKIEGDSVCDSSSTSFLVDVYALYTVEDIPLDIFANLGYAHSWNDVKRSTAGGSASADYDSNAVSSIGGLAYTFSNVGVDGLSIKPMIMYNIVWLNDDSSTESGAGLYNASVKSNDYVNLRSLVGLEAKYAITEGFAAMLRAFWVHEFCDNSYDVDYTIAAATSFLGNAVYRGIESEDDAAVLGLGLSYQFDESISAFLDYSATLRKDYSAHGLDVGVKFKF